MERREKERYSTFALFVRLVAKGQASFERKEKDFD